MRSAGSVSSAGNCFCVLDFEITSVPFLNFFFLSQSIMCVCSSVCFRLCKCI